MAPSTSALLNKALRKYVAPPLREAGFVHVDARNAWNWQSECICVFNIRAVGNYFSEVTGWPPGSVGVWLGVHFTFGPPPRPIKVDKQQRLRPKEHECHMRSHLDCSLDQGHRVRHFQKGAERDRTDLWWVEPDGSNADEVARSIGESVSGQALPWFDKASDLESALGMVEDMRDCFNKFTKATLIAKQLGDDARWKKYDALAEATARRIGNSVDRGDWHGV